MGTKKISELTELETLNNNDLVAVVDVANEATKKMTAKKLGAATGIPTDAVIGFEGDTIPGGYEEIDGKALIMGRVDTDYTITSTQNYEDIIIRTTQNIKKGNGISLQNNGEFSIGNGVSLVKISVVLTIQSGSSEVLGLQIYKNSQVLTNTFKYKYGTNFDAYSIANYIIEVQEGDVIFVAAYIDVSGTSLNIKAGTYITIEEL